MTGFLDKAKLETDTASRSQNGGTPEQAVATTMRPAEGNAPADPKQPDSPPDLYIYGQKK